MNGITRNLLLILSASLLSVATVCILLYFEARSGELLFGYNLAGYVPVGALAAGLLVACGLLGCALLLRARPAPFALLAFVALSGAIIFLAQSAEVLLAVSGRGPASDPVTFGQFLVNAVLQSPLQSQRSRSESADASSSAPATMGVARAIPQTGPDNNAQVDSISSGVQGVVASQDVGMSISNGGAQRIAQINNGLHSLNSAVQNHGTQWLTMGLQFIAFSAGGVLVFLLLRSRPHCDDCSLLLSGKGMQKRYFDRLEDINGSVEDVLSKARNRRLQLSIQAHGSRGAAQKGKLSEFASIVNVSHCNRCQTHHVAYRALRKSGASWKEIPVLGYSASTLETVEIG